MVLMCVCVCVCVCQVLEGVWLSNHHLVADAPANLLASLLNFRMFQHFKRWMNG
jgi:hypothetical protein